MRWQPDTHCLHTNTLYRKSVEEWSPIPILYPNLIKYFSIKNVVYYINNSITLIVIYNI